MATNGGINDVRIGDVKVVAWKLLLQHGPWALLTIALIATILGWFPSPLSRDIENVRQMIIENRRVIIDTNYKEEINHGYQNVLLRAICRNMVALQQQGQCEPRYYGYEEREKK